VAKAMASTEEQRLRQRRNRVAMIAGAAVFLLVALPAAVYFSQRTTKALPAAASALAATSAASTPSRDSAAVNAGVPVAAPAPLTGAPSSAPASAKAPVPKAPAADLAVLRTLQSTALDVRRRAADAGASADQLSAGDAHNRMANALALQGKAVEAGDHLNQATLLWNAAERNARAGSTQVAQATRVPVVDAPKSQPALPATVTTTSVQQASVIPQAPAAPAANPAADIGAAVAAYARALESRDVATVRRAYPGITSTQAKGWEQFFGTLRSLRVTLGVSGLDVNGSSAEAKLVGTYDYVTEGGKSTQQPVAFQAAFVREGSVWQLMSVH